MDAQNQSLNIVSRVDIEAINEIIIKADSIFGY